MTPAATHLSKPGRASDVRWHRLDVVLPREASEEFCVRCFELGSCGLQSEDDDGVCRISAYFGGGLDVAALAGQIDSYLRAGGFSACELDWSEEAERDWNHEWRTHYRPLRVAGRFVVHPPWIPVETTGGEIAIAVEPGMAFGTGGHESTQLCLRALIEVDVVGRRCLDLGSGSGILAIAAILMGAQSVTGVDIDPRAVENARYNVKLNLARDVTGAPSHGDVRILPGSMEAVAGERFDIILANLESHILQPMLAPIRDVIDDSGTVVFSGLLTGEQESFARMIGKDGFVTRRLHRLNNWLCCVARSERAGRRRRPHRERLECRHSS